MVRAGIVEIHRLLDEAESEDVGVEVEIARRLSGDRCHVVNAWHGEASCRDGLLNVCWRNDRDGGTNPAAADFAVFNRAGSRSAIFQDNAA
jgi:hypothetical protein